MLHVKLPHSASSNPHFTRIQPQTYPPSRLPILTRKIKFGVQLNWTLTNIFLPKKGVRDALKKIPKQKVKQIFFCKICFEC